MDSIAQYHQLKDLLSNGLGISHHVLHIHAGLMIYVGTQLILGTRRASWVALVLVFGFEGANELLDWVFFGELRLNDTVSDIVATVLWPSILYAASKYRRHKWRAEIRHNRRARKFLLMRAWSLQRAIPTDPIPHALTPRRARLLRS